MKRSFPPPAREALFGAVALAALGFCTGCEPDNNVQPGAPVLTTMVLVAAGGSTVTVTKDTPDCPAGIVGGEACDPMMDTLCKHPAPGWCNCVADMTDMTMGAWDCSPVPVLGVIAIFDRLLDTAPFDASYPAGTIGAMTGTTPSASAPTFDVISDYASTGTPMGVNPLFATFVFGNPRNTGPSLFGAGDPAFPSGAAVTVQLEATKVHAKDGTTAFTAEGTLANGQISFTTPAFTGAIVPADAMTPLPSVSFNNNVSDTVVGHIKVTANGVDVTADLDVMASGPNVTIAPKMGTMPFPTGAIIVITVDATAPNALGQTIDAAQVATYTAP